MAVLEKWSSPLRRDRTRLTGSTHFLPMPKTFAGLLLLLFAASVSCTVTPVQVQVLSYNIHHGEGVDGRFDLERQAAVILASGADLVALQEVDVRTTRANGVDQAMELARLTGMFVAFGEAIAYADGSYGDAVLSRWPILQNENLTLPAAANHEKRVAVSIEVQVPHGPRIRFVGTHLDHTKDPADRIQQAQALNDALLPATMPTLLVGDLNAQPASQPMLVLLQAGWQAADASLAPTFPSVDPQRKIDWVLQAQGFGTTLVQPQVMTAPVASDHCPFGAIWLLPRRLGKGSTD